MLLFLFMFGVTLGAVSPLDEVKLQRGSCPMFWFSFSGRCYKYISTCVTWADAELYCVSQKANLVSIHTLEEHHFVKELIRNSDHSERPTWIGLSDIHKEGKWMWSDGSAVDFVFWNTNEPNNNGGHENCVQNNYDTAQKWNDARCSDNLPSVCAYRITCP
ncbi:lactose-binding lectin l-2 [Larimichthys crocea]|uniref:lactose-binding lectin l-2 n=1 Tax=Larimichthys crocea TaxID=215358 RepID=UPI000900C763|nr:lactose-binding lectin l-2 [Larimichthys crocea]